MPYTGEEQQKVKLSFSTRGHGALLEANVSKIANVSKTSKPGEIDRYALTLVFEEHSGAVGDILVLEELTDEDFDVLRAALLALRAALLAEEP